MMNFHCGMLDGDSSVEFTDENREASQESKAKAMEAISEGTLLSI